MFKSCGFQSGDFVIKLNETLSIHHYFYVYVDNCLTFIELHR